ncbi:DNF1 [Candida pseudojiufengensis]|uniref:DNF1 n=1 Tax=Candida pseudojiufengensis TaxID=497109 RepID=UPI0022254492|nr:DNF1 [Candida pseudojiufengensis]KAI5964147.1 DNF1 [Candida pseudojiufengensis]
MPNSGKKSRRKDNKEDNNNNNNDSNQLSPFSDPNESFDADNSSILQSPNEDEFNNRQYNNNSNIDHTFSDDSMPPTPQLNTDKFEGGRSSSLRFQLPPNHNNGNSHNNNNLNNESPYIPATPPISSSSSSNNGSKQTKSPFLDQYDTILEDQLFEKPTKITEEHERTEEFSSQEDEPMEDLDINNDNNNDDYNHIDGPTKRHRWGTTRNKQGRPKKENVSRSKTLKKILHPHHNHNKHHHKSLKGRIKSIRKPNTHSIEFPESHHRNDSDSDIIDPDAQDSRNRKQEKRTIVFNRSLPSEFLDPESGKPITNYPRNKIRTTKYTPLTFLPKNIFNQFFHNIANIYFLILIILGAFDIFGVPSPVLAAVPLIVIVIITAIKDAIEDSRRTITDLEVNNQHTHILEQVNENSSYHYENQNVDDETISLWRRYKKWNSRLLLKVWGASKRNLTKEGRANKERQKYNEQNNIQEQEQGRKSFDSDILTPTTTNQDHNPFGDTLRKSFQQQRRESHHYHPKVLKFVKKYWKDVKVGDILRIYNNDEIPADLVILSTSDDDNGCFVETKNLDGETNLKVKQALKYSSVNDKVTKADDLMTHSFEIESEGPHSNLYSYEGNLKYISRNGEENQEPITINNLLLRGCSLRNTKWVIGIVVFTGDDTKIMLNAGVTPTKQSRISRELNYYVLLNFLLLFIICFISAMINGFYYRKTGTSRDYFEFGTIAGTPALNGLVGFFVSLILYQSLVPISLYITIEIIKTAQAYFIYSDVMMYYPNLDFPCTPKSWSISDDLGQIEYVFSDKTGTLTQNVMEFKKCTINGKSYGLAYTEALAGLRKRMGIDVETEAIQEREIIRQDKDVMLEKLHEISKNQTYDDELTFISSKFIDDLEGKNGEEQQDCNHHFMLALALCHSVLTEQSNKNPHKLILKAQSPDEAALVGTARSLGFNFKGTTKKGFLVDELGITKEYQVLNTLEFNSTRKRMSCIIKIPPENPEDEPRALLICKGADSIIYERLSKDYNDPIMLESTAKHLEEYATEGLRTLCIAEREISWSQYLEWNKRHQIAASALENREDKMESVADSIERELILLGGTAIEDRLQNGVPDAIQLLADAGIKLWVLTGDKVETAINIGFSCNLLGNDMNLLVIKTSYSEEEMKNLGNINFGFGNGEAQIIDTIISYYLQNHFNSIGSYEDQDNAIGDHTPPDERFGIVIDGDALKIALLNVDTKRKFLLLCKKCRAVLCCRVSPAQKAAVVKLVKDTLDVMTLAIGDGSNDVAMIQAADVGVGIAGEEGRQAVMSSDFAIGQFRFLARLLLTHGRWSYKRFSEMIPSFFYKNIIFNIALFWYGIYCDFDGTYLFEFTYLMFYNLAFTSLPIIFLGIFDQDVDAKVSMLVPQLYRSGILRNEMSDLKFYLYCLDGIYQSAISFFFPYLLYLMAFPNMNGKPVDHRFWMGIIVTCIACISCNCYLLFHQYRWDWLSSLIVAISILIIFIWTGLWTTTVSSSGEFYKAAPEVFGMTSFWACMFIGILCCLIPRFFYDFVQKIYWPKDIDIIRECIQRGDFDAYPINYDPTDPDRQKISSYSTNALNRMSMGSNSFKRKSNEPIKTNSSNDEEEDSYNRKDIFDQLNNKTYQPPTPPPGILMSPLRRKTSGAMKRIFQKRSNSDNYFINNNNTYNNQTVDSLPNTLQTEEIPLDDFNTDNRLSISNDNNNNKRVSSMYK